MSERRWTTLGAALGFLAVAGGAFGAHVVKDALKLPADRLAWFDTGSEYLMAHALALLLVGRLAARSLSRAVDVAGWAFVAGILVFTGSLWTMTLTGIRWLGAVTPLGGTAFLVGWAALALAAWRLPSPPPPEPPRGAEP